MGFRYRIPRWNQVVTGNKMQKVNWKLDKPEAHRKEKRKRMEISYTWQTRKKENFPIDKAVACYHQPSIICPNKHQATCI